MLKKAGIIAAAATVTLLAMSPLAFADTNNNGSASQGLLNASDNNGAVSGQFCNNDIPLQGGAFQGQVPVKDLTGAVTGALALLGKADAVTTQDTDNSSTCGDNVATAGDENDQDN